MLKRQYFDHLMQRADSLEKTLMVGKIKGRRRGGDRRWDSWRATPTQWTWVCANSMRWWRTGRPGMMQPIESPRIGPDLVTKQQHEKRHKEQYINSRVFQYPTFNNWQNTQAENQQEMMNVKYTLDQKNVPDIYRTLHPTAAEHNILLKCTLHIFEGWSSNKTKNNS